MPVASASTVLKSSQPRTPRLRQPGKGIEGVDIQFVYFC
jgi:hypothetical protein